MHLLWTQLNRYLSKLPRTFIFFMLSLISSLSLQVYISSLALLKMLKHGRAGVPMEVMGLMLGEFVDDYTVRVIDVFAMPQTGTVNVKIKTRRLTKYIYYNDVRLLRVSV